MSESQRKKEAKMERERKRCELGLPSLTAHLWLCREEELSSGTCKQQYMICYGPAVAVPIFKNLVFFFSK